MRSVVLVAGVPQSSFGELAPVLDRQKLTVIQVPSIEDAVMYARSARVELIILGPEPTAIGLEEVIQTIRSKSSASRNASLLVMAEPESEDNVRQLIGHGVNRVMLTVDPPTLVSLQVAELLEIAPRASLRLSTRMLVEVEDGFAEALGAVVNISAAGLLLETDADLEPGQHVIISIDVGPQLEPVAAKAEIVRKTDPEREGIEGIGAQFLSFAGDSQNSSRPSSAMLSEFRSTRCGPPPSNHRTATSRRLDFYLTGFDREVVVGDTLALIQMCKCVGSTHVSFRPSELRERTEALALEKFHNDVGHAVVLTDIVDRADVGVVEGRSRARLAHEASEPFGVTGEIPGENLDRHLTIEA